MSNAKVVRKRLKKLYITKVDAAISKRIYATQLMEEAEAELAKALGELKALDKKKEEPDEVRED